MRDELELANVHCVLKHIPSQYDTAHPGCLSLLGNTLVNNN